MKLFSESLEHIIKTLLGLKSLKYLKRYLELKNTFKIGVSETGTLLKQLPLTIRIKLRCTSRKCMA